MRSISMVYASNTGLAGCAIEQAIEGAFGRYYGANAGRFDFCKFTKTTRQPSKQDVLSYNVRTCTM